MISIYDVIYWVGERTAIYMVFICKILVARYFTTSQVEHFWHTLFKQIFVESYLTIKG